MLIENQLRSTCRTTRVLEIYWNRQDLVQTMVFIKDAQELEHVNLAQLKSEDGEATRTSLVEHHDEHTMHMAR